MSYARRKVLKALSDRGFVVLREGGSHTIIGKPGQRGEPVPRHNELNRFTTKRIARNLGIDWNEFESDIR
ncbi:MAG: type II toxin-antitoxin system HicA family toxin [Phycisphaeraceae bacterium]|nr:type II toxin-antitoxin system HicA family toxin [Phycisphaeraceae bacterium]